MIQNCSMCGKLLSEGDLVTVRVTSTYHILKSTIAYALDRHNMQADSDTLKHKNCNAKEGD